jgi:O-antigen ligase
VIVQKIHRKFNQTMDRISKIKEIRTLLGIPFGEQFIPGRVIRNMEANRYDPHNSVIAIFYRTGLLGFIFFMWILLQALKRAITVARHTTSIKHKELILAVAVALAYHWGHSMSDVTLENPFKGGVYWLLLGLLIALTSMKQVD